MDNIVKTDSQISISCFDFSQPNTFYRKCPRLLLYTQYPYIITAHLLAKRKSNDDACNPKWPVWNHVTRHRAECCLCPVWSTHDAHEACQLKGVNSVEVSVRVWLNCASKYCGDWPQRIAMPQHTSWRPSAARRNSPNGSWTCAAQHSGSRLFNLSGILHGFL
jgi:hypothetical protein